MYNDNKNEILLYQYIDREDEGGYIADIPDLVHCSAFGETPEEALAQALIAKNAWLEAAQAEGKPLPEPKYRPIIYHMSVATGLGQVAEEKSKYK